MPDTTPKKHTPKHIPYTLHWDSMPLDLSFLYADDKPAGRHGFVRAMGDRFLFEDGKEARFWGTNFNGAANFPTHEHSEKVARRLACIGVNMVRLHQLDAEWHTPNIFEFSRGALAENTLRLDPRSMDRLDYMISCMKAEGIYIYMDFLTYRRFRSGDGVPAAEELREAAKPYSNYSRVLLDLQKKFNADFMNHVNPYTGLAYKDDPVIAMAELTNENDLFHEPKDAWAITLEPYRSELEGMYREFAASKGVAVGSEKVDFSKRDAFMFEFLCAVQMGYYRELIGHLRSIGVKMPVTGTNWAINAALAYCNTATDFTDSHAYWWRGDQRSFGNELMTKEPGTIVPNLALNKVAGMPLFVSEWDQPWPNEWRAEQSLYLAAVGALQGWSGFTIHTYRYGTNERESVAGKIGRRIVLGNSYYRGIFDTYNDPAKFGLFYHAAIITRRADVSTAKERRIVKIDPHDAALMAKPAGLMDRKAVAAMFVGCEKHRVALGFDASADANEVVAPDKPIVDLGAGEVLSDTKELYRSWARKYGWIDTPRTKAVYGMVGTVGPIKLDGMELAVDNDFATLAVSSLSQDPIAASRNMLLTAVGRADNKNIRYNDEHTVQLDEGSGPIMVEVIEAEVAITTSRRKLKVWSVNDEGFLTGTTPCTYKDGVLRFRIGGELPSMYYLIQEQ
jgi:hypothetical protein